VSLRLLETLRAEGGRVALLDRHLARLAASAGAFGYAFEPDGVRDRIAAALVGAAPADVHRVRLTLGPHLDVEVEAARLDGFAFRTVWLCPEPLAEAGGPLCVHKTTDREHYERPYRAALARGADEAVLVNARGEVVEGTRTSVWVERGGRLLTPPLGAGGLPGVARAVVLETVPAAAEATLTPGDLRTADALFLSNAVRGLVRVRLLDESGRGGAEYGPPPLPRTS
jgi:branched-subunit amino acid aminotransferase/4-amino-4-deoxychorismate lyase